MKKDRDTLQNLVLDVRGRFEGAAIDCEDRSVSYQEFDMITDRIATGLQAMGIGRKRFVAIRMPRTEKMIEAIFGVVKSGAAYVPVNEDTPPERFRAMTEACPDCLVLDEKMFDRLLAEQPDSGEKNFVFRPDETLAAREEDPAVVLFTSGTTGTPKGVCHSQRSVRFLFSQFPNRIGETGMKPAPFLTVIGHLQQGFVVSYHYEYPAALLNGRKLVLLTETEQHSIPAMCSALEKNESCMLAIMPTQLAVYLEDERFVSNANRISCLQFFTEPVADSLRSQILKVFPKESSAICLYGQTETTSIAWKDVRDTEEGMVLSPGTKIRLLDEDNADVPQGQIGQICIHTPTMFSCFLMAKQQKPGEQIDIGQKDKERSTAEEQYALKNILLNGERYVRTGDVGFLTEKGRIVLKGRNDRMIKFHGQRVELPEIEKVMLCFPGITRSAVVVAHTAVGTKVLAGYFTAGPNEQVDLDLLRCHLQEHLPAYMLPAVLVQMEQLPLGNNGKTDLRKLKNLTINAPDELRSSALRRPAYTDQAEQYSPEKEEHATDNGAEQRIRRIAAGILQIPETCIMRDSSLIAMGMDSLSAVLLISRLYEEGYSMTMKDFLDAGTVTGLAKRLKSSESVSKNRMVSDVFPLTDMQTEWAIRKNKILMTHVAEAGLDQEQMKTRMERIAEIHPALRSVFFSDGNAYYSKVLAKKTFWWKHYDLRQMRSDRQLVSIQMYIDQTYPSLNPGDLFTAAAFRMEDRKTALVLTYDHQAVDGISARILTEELFRDLSDEKQDSYIDWLERIHKPENVRAAEEFWREYLQGASPACLRENQAPTGKSAIEAFSFSLAPAQLSELEHRCKRVGVSVPSMVLYAYAKGLQELNGNESVFVQGCLSGRSYPMPGMERIVGCLVNSVPVRYNRKDSVSEFMRGCILADQYGFLPMKQIMLAAFGHASVPMTAPFLTSLLFPSRENDVRLSPLFPIDYVAMAEGDFLWQDEQGLHVVFHIDTDRWDSFYIKELLLRMENTLNFRFA